MSEAPAVGHVLHCERCGRETLKRVFSVAQVSAAVAVQAHGYPYISRQHSGLPGCKEDANGHPIIRSATHEREVVRMAADQGWHLQRE